MSVLGDMSAAECDTWVATICPWHWRASLACMQAESTFHPELTQNTLRIIEGDRPAFLDRQLADLRSRKHRDQVCCFMSLTLKLFACPFADACMLIRQCMLCSRSEMRSS